MSTEVNVDYYSNDDTLNSHIDNIIILKKYLDKLLREIKSGEYNTVEIKKLSQISEEFFNEREDTPISEYKFNPRSSIVEIKSDTSDLDTCNPVSDCENESGVESSDEEKVTKLFEHKITFEDPVDNDEPNFLDDEKKTDSNHNYQTNSHEYLSTGSLSQNDTYNQTRYLGNYKYYPHPHYNDSQPSIYEQYKNHKENRNHHLKIDSDNILRELCNRSQLKSKYERSYERFEKMHNKYNTMHTPKPKDKDKLTDEFLNNNLVFDNYHYLKSFNTKKAEDYINQCYTY